MFAVKYASPKKDQNTGYQKYLRNYKKPLFYLLLFFFLRFIKLMGFIMYSLYIFSFIFYRCQLLINLLKYYLPVKEEHFQLV